MAYYLWAALAFNTLSPNGYYNYLARGWQEGHLHTPIEVNPKLLALPNPYDPAVPDEIKVHDMALYKGHYFLYHGPAPALLTIYPYLLLTGKNLPEPIAVFVFASLGFIACAFALQKQNPAATPLQFLALGLANCVPFLLHRIWVYELAIISGFACLAVAYAFSVFNRPYLAGLALGFAILSRPHLALALPFFSPRSWPTAALGLSATLLHNYLRFDSPLEFGLHYLIAGPDQQSPNYSLQNLIPSLYLFWLEIPRLLNHFPFLAIHNLPPLNLPPKFFHENIMGALWLSPFLLLSKPLWRPAAISFAILLFLSSTGWVSQRYLVDFLPLLVLASLASKAKPTLQIPLLLFGIVTNLLLHVQGPYNAP
ncbi:MAG: hypothetical protein NTW74_12670 [Acidobacteria bacterium]|nr:hypothetical protein [Acidobacteriota bacterium]